MKIAFLCPYPPHGAPSQRFRFEQYIDLLRIEKHKTTQLSFLTQKGWHILYKEGHILLKTAFAIIGYLRRIWHLIIVLRYDMVFIHRELTPAGPPLFEWLICVVFRKKVIYDFDDAIWIPDINRQSSLMRWLKCYWKVKWICRWSHRVSCGNEYLRTFASTYNRASITLPTTIDTKNLHNPNRFARTENDVPVIGWTGTHSTLRYLENLLPTLVQLEKECVFKLLVIGNKPPSLALTSLVFKPWSIDEEIDDLLKMDIGLMPLTFDRWSQGKCGFKALQYMSLKIPVVASPVGVNSEIINHGLTGFLAHTDEEWLSSLRMLLREKQTRQSVGCAARDFVEKHYSVRSNTPLFLSLFE